MEVVTRWGASEEFVTENGRDDVVQVESPFFESTHGPSTPITYVKKSPWEGAPDGALFTVEKGELYPVVYNLNDIQVMHDRVRKLQQQRREHRKVITHLNRLHVADLYLRNHTREGRAHTQALQGRVRELNIALDDKQRVIADLQEQVARSGTLYAQAVSDKLELQEQLASIRKLINNAGIGGPDSD